MIDTCSLRTHGATVFSIRLMIARSLKNKHQIPTHVKVPTACRLLAILFLFLCVFYKQTQAHIYIRQTYRSCWKTYSTWARIQSVFDRLMPSIYKITTLISFIVLLLASHRCWCCSCQSDRILFFTLPYDI